MRSPRLVVSFLAPAACVVHTAFVALAAVAAVAAVAGCTPSPERLCERKMQLVQRMGKMDADTWREGFRHCVELAREEQRANPEKYRCRADCVIAAKRLTDAAECDQKCK